MSNASGFAKLLEKTLAGQPVNWQQNSRYNDEGEHA